MDSDLIYRTADVSFTYSTTDTSKIIYTVSNSCTLSEEFYDKAKGGWIKDLINMRQLMTGKAKSQKLKASMLTLEVKNKIPKLFLIPCITYHTPLSSGCPTSHIHLREQSPLLTLLILPASKQGGHENKQETWRHSDSYCKANYAI